MSALPIAFSSGLNTGSKKPPRLLDMEKLTQYFQLSADPEVGGVGLLEMIPTDTSFVLPIADVVTASAPNVSLTQTVQQGVNSAWPGQANLVAGETPNVDHIPPLETYESAEIRWLRENSSILRDYQGEWLLISGDTLIAHSSDFRTIRTAITERGIVSPFVYYVPTEEEANFVLI